MKTIERNALIGELKKVTESIIESATAFKRLSVEELNERENAESWSILECLEHLNRYGEYYLVEIEKRILAAPEEDKATHFSSGWLGNYFVGMIQPQEDQIKKMKTPKSMNPLHAELEPTVIDRFLKQQRRMLQLLKQAETIDLTNTKTSITLTNFIKLRLGDTFRFVIYHNQRHVMQAERIVERMRKELIKKE